MTLPIPMTVLATDPVEAAGKLIDRDVKPMYELACDALDKVAQANFRASASTLRIPRGTIAEGRVWFGSEQYLLNYAEALFQRLGPGAVMRHAVTIPAPLQEKTNKPPNWLMVPEIRAAHIARLMRYDDLLRLDARLEYLLRQAEGTDITRRPHCGGSFLYIMQRQRSSNASPLARRTAQPERQEQLIVLAISHLGIDARRGDYYQTTLRGMRDFIRSLDCYAQSPSAFFRRNNYADITGMNYRTYYELSLKNGVFSVSNDRYTTLMRDRQQNLRAMADDSVSAFTDSVNAARRPTNVPPVQDRTPYRQRVRVMRGGTTPTSSMEEINRQYIRDANGQAYYMDLQFSQDRPEATFWIAPDDHAEGSRGQR